MSHNHNESIMIVEDDPELAEIYYTVVAEVGYDVALAHNGKEALQLAETHPPRLILLDLRMPVMDGVGFLENYDVKNKHPSVKVVIFSNYDMQDEIDKAFRLGADRYVLKAWMSPRELLQLVESSLA